MQNINVNANIKTNTMPITPISRHAVLGVLAGGQLGRMTMLAAAQWGIKTISWDPNPDAPAHQICQEPIIQPFEHQQALQEFLNKVDRVLVEWENIPLDLLNQLAVKKPTLSNAEIFALAQSRHAEKKFFQNHAVKTAEFVFLPHTIGKTISKQVSNCSEKKTSELNAALPNQIKDFVFPALLKTDRLGYDGKGQWRVANIEELIKILTAEWQRQPSQDFILEQLINFSRECSVLVARDFFGNSVCYPVTENEHNNGILDKSFSQAVHINAAVKNHATSITSKLANALNLVGLLCVEYFVTANNELLANEMAPRPHNSFHWTMDGTDVSQFQQWVRIALGLKVQAPTLTHQVVMQNIMGNDIDHWQNYLTESNQSNHKNLRLHNYGKTNAKPGRKMGHVNIII